MRKILIFILFTCFGGVIAQETTTQSGYFHKPYWKKLERMLSLRTTTDSLTIESENFYVDGDSLNVNDKFIMDSDGTVTVNDESVQTFPSQLLVEGWGGGDVFRFYVDPTLGSDDNDGQTWATAKATLQATVNALPQDMGGYTQFILLKAGETYPGLQTIGKSNGAIEFLWCGAFVDTANTPGKYSYWVRNGATTPIGSNDPVVLLSDTARSDSRFLTTYTNSSLYIRIQASNYDFAWSEVGFGYWGRMELRTIAGLSSYYGLLQNWSSPQKSATIVSECGLVFYAENHGGTDAILSGSDNIWIGEAEFIGDASVSANNSGSVWRAMIYGGSNTTLRGTANIKYHASYDRPYAGKAYVVRGTVNVFAGWADGSTSSYNFSNMYYDPDWLTSDSTNIELHNGYYNYTLNTSSANTTITYAGDTGAGTEIRDGVTTTKLSTKIIDGANSVIVNNDLEVDGDSVNFNDNFIMDTDGNLDVSGDLSTSGFLNVGAEVEVAIPTGDSTITITGGNIGVTSGNGANPDTVSIISGGAVDGNILFLHRGSSQNIYVQYGTGNIYKGSASETQDVLNTNYECIALKYRTSISGWISITYN